MSERFTEVHTFINLIRRRRPVDIFSDSRPGSSRTGRLQYAFDDHRDAHIDAIDADFSRNIVAELGALARSVHARRVIVCASPRMLGALRDAAVGEIATDEVPHNLVKLTPGHLRERLGELALLPA